MGEEKPIKSAYELAMERLQKKDEAAGIERRSLTDEQRAAIAEIRSFYQAKLAEAEILHRDTLHRTADPAERQALEDDYRRERERLAGERDAKIEKARQGA